MIDETKKIIDLDKPLNLTPLDMFPWLVLSRKKRKLPSGISRKAFEAVEDAVSDAMIEYGPDGHIDGSDEISIAAIKALRKLGWRPR